MVLYICAQWFVFLFGKTTSNGLWVRPSGRPAMFPEVHTWGVSQGLRAPCFLRKQALPVWHLKKKNFQVKIRLFSCLWRVGPSPVLFLKPGASCVTASSPLLCVLRQATTSPSPLRLQGAPCSFLCQVLRVLNHLCSLSCSFSKLWGPWALWGGTAPLSLQRVWSAGVRAKQIGSSPPLPLCPAERGWEQIHKTELGH